MAAFGAGSPNLPPRVLEFAAAPDAADWARVCGWLPGTGHCRNRACGAACVLHAERAADARRLTRWRRLRRRLGRR